MSASFGLNPATNEIEVTKDGRTVLTTAGTLVNLLPDLFTDTVELTFPDLTKDWGYLWTWESDYNSLANAYGWGVTGRSWISAPPQEWSDTSIIAAAPAGADIFASRIRINRTVDPDDMGGQPLNVLPPTDKWIPFSGSVLVEAEICFARAFSLYIEDGNLVLHRQQSVGPAPGGWGTFGHSAPTGLADTAGGAVHAGTNEGITVWRSASSPYVKSSSGTVGGSFGYASIPYTRHRWNGSDPCSLVDPTDFSSTYQIEIVGQFGRRS